MILFCCPDDLFSQCTPDPDCIDINEPGQVCPPEMPEGTVGEPYEETVTIIPPGTANIGGNDVTLIKIVITDIGNLPPGLTYEPNAPEFYSDSSYCILISGTPTTAGTYPLHIKVIPYVDIFGTPVAAPEQTDTTSSSITIVEPIGVENITDEDFYILKNRPNPFRNITRIGFISGSRSNVELRVYNVLGKTIYNETIYAQPGQNYFNFTGKYLIPGIYIYNISNSSKIYTRQMVKTE